MNVKLAIDFGTTNSVIARWADDRAVIESLPGLTMTTPGVPPLIPSLLYVADGQRPVVNVGDAVRARRADQERDNRLFRDFKRGIVAVDDHEPRLIDGVPWSDRDAGRYFLNHLLTALPYTAADIEQLVLTAPVASFTGYFHWLNETIPLAADRVRLVDESTAAALGYAVTEPEAVVLVFDFGGGTLDLSLVQLPASTEKTGGLLGRLRRGGARDHTARVIAKAGRLLGGSDVDRWLMAEVLRQTQLTVDDLGPGCAPLLTACEEAKIALSTSASTAVTFTDARYWTHTVHLSRADLEGMLAANGFYASLHGVIDKVMHVARREGIFKEDIRYVLLVGGTSLMPSVQAALADYFDGLDIRAEKPFTAVAEGALQLAAGCGLDDYLPASFGLRHYNPQTRRTEYDEIIPQGSRYPSEKPVEIILQAAHAGQTAIDLVIGEITPDAIQQVSVREEDGQAVFVAQTDSASRAITALNASDPLSIPLKPAGKHGQDRINAAFRVDDRRQLRVTATDLRTRRVLLEDAVLVTLGGGQATTNGQSLLPDIEDLAAYFREQIHAAAAEIQTDPAPEGAQPALTGREPTLSAGITHGQRRLSLRHLGGVLTALAPDTVTPEAAAAMLRSDEFYVRYNAGRLLARRADRSARLVLADALHDSHAPTRASAARCLYGFSWFTAEPLLRQALADSDRRVREAAIYALCDMRETPAFQLAAEALDGDVDDVRAAAAWGLRACTAPKAVPVLSAVLDADDPDVRIAGLEALGANDTRQAQAVVRAAIQRDPDPEVQYAAVLSLIELAEADCLPEICALIEAARATNRTAILRALFHATNYLKIDTAESEAADALITALSGALSDPTAEARMAAVWPLAWMQDPRAAEVLVTAYTHEADPAVRAHILRVASSLNSPAAMQIVP
jgi:molecular chaperone DnaK (HSP70)